MWSGAGPRAYSHWLIKTHMRTEDLMCRERSDPLSEGLITHSHWVACSLSHTWLCACVLACVCVFVRIVWSGCDLVYVGKRVRVSGIDCASRVWRFVCKSVLSLLLNVRSADDRFGSGDKHTHTQTHMNTCMQIHAPSSCPKHVVQSAALSWELWGSNRLINFSLSLF